MSDDFVEQKNRACIGVAPRKLPRISENDRDQECLLLAGGAVSRIHALGRVTDQKIAQMRADAGTPGLGIAHPCRFEPATEFAFEFTSVFFEQLFGFT